MITLSTSPLIQLKKILFIIFFIAICRSSFAQNDKVIDSLMNILKNANEDTNKVNLLNALSSRYLDITPNQGAKEYAEKALVLAEKINFKQGMSIAYFRIGLYYGQQSYYTEALKNFQAALKIDQEIDNRERIAGDYVIIGFVNIHWGNFPESLKYFLTALKIYEDIGCKLGIADAYNKIGIVNRMQGNYVDALKNHLSSLKLMEEIGDKGGIGNSYNLIGMAYWLQENYSEALENYLLGLKFRQETGVRDAIAGSYNNIGELYRTMGNYSEALKNQMTALKIAEETGNRYEIAIYQKDIGKVYVESGKNAEATRYLMSALSLSKEIGDKENIRDVCEALSKLDSAAGNYQQALMHYKLYTDYKDSLLNETNNRQIAQVKEQYESEKKDKEIALLNKEKAFQQLQLKRQKQAKNYFIAGIFLVAILSFFIYRNYRTRQKLKLLTFRNKVASDLHDDVGSTLSSISIFSQMAQQQSKEAIPLLETIGESSRKMLDAMADIVWTINPENDQFEKIISRMKNFAYELLGAKKIDFEFVSDEEVEKFKLPMEVRRNLYLIFKEATNNMVKYAGANKAMFAIKGGKNELTMMIRDNGTGFDVDKSTEGNGLKNMKKRAIEIGGQLKIDSHPGNGTLIEIRIAV